MTAAILILLPALLEAMGVPKSVKLPETHAVMVRAESAYRYAVAAVDAELPNASQIDRDVWVARLWAWSASESAWTVGAMGDCVDHAKRSIETCRAFGVMQTVNPERWGFSRVVVLADGVSGYRAGLRVMRFSIAKCGGVAAGLGMFASGTCGGAQYLVKHRCKLAGLSC